MDRQGFDPMTRSVGEVVAFMENIEATEDRPENKPKANNNNKTERAKKTKKTNNNNNNGKKQKHYCTVHGENWSHKTEDFKVLLNQNNNNQKPYQNKTWTKKSDDAKKETAKELATLVGKVVDKTVNKHFGSQKKRKSNDNDNEEGDCCLLEGLAGALDGFNYDNMDKMTIDNGSDDDEVSC